MTNIYTVTFYDNYNDEHSDSLVAIWLNKETALDYAARYNLEHEETITVEEKQEGVQDYIGIVIYERQHYDHTQALMNSTYYVGYDKTQEDVEKTAISQASPMCVNIDWDRLYLLYKELYVDDEDQD